MPYLPPSGSQSPSVPADVVAQSPTQSRAILSHALLLALAGDALLRGASAGVAFPLWIGILGIAMVSATRRSGRDVSREATGWLITAVLFAAGLAWRDSSILQPLDVLATLGALAMAAIALGNSRAALLAERFRHTIWAAVALARVMAAGFIPLAVRELFATEARGRWTSRVRPVVRSTLIAGTLLVVFGSLLRGADPIFASLVELPQLDVELLVSHVFVIGGLCWLVSGWMSGALGPELRQRRAPESWPFGLSLLDITTALGTLSLLFAAFVVVQLGWFFGGESFLRARTGLTAAEYARRGFFEMVWVVMLVVPLLVATRAALRPGRALERRHTLLSVPVIALLGAMILSAVTRMQLYVTYYGLTVDRFYPLVFMAWLSVVLVWLALTVLRGHGRVFIAGVAISGLVVLAALNVVAPDALIARFNIDRAARVPRPSGSALDLRHMANLSAEAATLATRALLAASATADGTRRGAADDAQRCYAALTLLRRWGPASQSAKRREADGAWRYWNAGETRAIRLVRERSAELRTVQHTACPGVPRAERGK